MLRVEWEDSYPLEENDLALKDLSNLEGAILEAVRWLKTRSSIVKHTVSMRLKINEHLNDSTYNLNVSLSTRNKPVITIRKCKINSNGEIDDAIIGRIKF